MLGRVHREMLYNRTQRTAAIKNPNVWPKNQEIVRPFSKVQARIDEPRIGPTAFVPLAIVIAKPFTEARLSVVTELLMSMKTELNAETDADEASPNKMATAASVESRLESEMMSSFCTPVTLPTVAFFVVCVKAERIACVWERKYWGSHTESCA